MKTIFKSRNTFTGLTVRSGSPLNFDRLRMAPEEFFSVKKVYLERKPTGALCILQFLVRVI